MLAVVVNDMFGCFEDVSISHILREGNPCADYMAREMRKEKDPAIILKGKYPPELRTLNFEDLAVPHRRYHP